MLHLSLWILTAALGQAPADTPLLEAVPPEADVVVRVRGVEAARDDLIAMLKATSQTLADMAVPAIERHVAGMKQQFGDKAVSQPFLVMMRVVRPDEPDKHPFAIVVKPDPYEAVLKSVAGGNDPKIQREDAGYDSFEGPGGQRWYAVKGANSVAFGPDKTLIAAFAKPGQNTLGKTLPPSLRKQLFAGDVGLYVNAKALTTRYAAEIDQARQQFMAQMDQVGARSGNSGMVESGKRLYGGLFDSLKLIDALVVNLDGSADGLSLGAELTFREGTEAAKSVASAKSGDAAGIAKLPSDLAYFYSMNMDARTVDRLQTLGLRMMSPEGKLGPEMEAALAKLRNHGNLEVVGGMAIADGMRMLGFTKVADPKAFIDDTQAVRKAERARSYIKESTITPDANSHRGISFTRLEMTLDLDKLAKLNQLQPADPAVGDNIKAMLGSNRVTTWYGSQNSQVIQLTAPSWEKAQDLLDASLDGRNTLGATPGFKAVRDKLPERASLLGLFSAQGLVRQVVISLSNMTRNPDLKPPDNLPKDAALIGVSLTPAAPNGYEFRLVVPSTVGPVFEQGFSPVLRGFAR